MALFRRGEIELLRLFDQRADPIDLRAGGDRTPDSGDHLLRPLERDIGGRDGLPPRRLLVEAGDIHVAIAREQKRARDGRRRHDEKLGAAAASLALQREPLMHAETMLLVDHDQAEIAELDALLKESVRADENVDATLFERGEDGLALAAALASREQGDAEPRGLAERGDRLHVLAREKLGRRHQRALRFRLDRAGKREQRHHRLAAADIALQQAQHAVRAREVGVDLGERALLCAGELEGELGEDRLAQPPGRRRAAGLRASSCAGG